MKIKSLLLSLALLFASCDQSLHSIEKGLKRSVTPASAFKKTQKDILIEEWVLILLLTVDSSMLDSSVFCIFPPNNYYDNPIYSTAAYYPNYMAASNAKQYQNIVIGDSTMDLSKNVSGWLNPLTTYVFSTSGNRFCDMIRQWNPPKIQKNVQLVILATAGGNDLIEGEDNNSVIANGKALINKARSQWPNAKIVMIGVHPTLIAAGNTNKAITNSALQTYLGGMTNTCFYDPWPLFTGVTNNTMAAQASDLLDTIHYNSAMSLLIKTALNTNCSITF